MQSRNIPVEQWIEYFDEFSRGHDGWLVTIQVLDRENGPQTVAQSLPLQGISFDTKGTRPSALVISAGDRAEGHIDHVVDLPLHIRQSDDPNRIELQIEPADGSVTLVHVQERAT